MFRMVKIEFRKLRRYYMIWAGIFLMLLSVLLTAFSTTASDGTLWTFSFFAEQVIKNNTTMIFPACIALTAGYIIAREEADDTLKSILTVPVPYRQLLGGKLFVCALLSLFLGIVSAGFTVAAVLILGFPGISGAALLQAFLQITLNCLFLYLAVTPVIAVAARMPGGHMIGAVVAFVYGYGGMFAAGDAALASLYPVTASLGLIRYRSYDPAVHWNTPLCLLSMFTALLICAAFVFTAKGDVSEKATKKPKKNITKKGW